MSLNAKLRLTVVGFLAFSLSAAHGPAQKVTSSEVSRDVDVCMLQKAKKVAAIILLLFPHLSRHAEVCHNYICSK
jgi:hypothetical protein